MKNSSLWEREHARIQGAYAARPEGEFFGFEDPHHLARIQDREWRTLDLLARLGLTSLAGARVLEAGCGDGREIATFYRWGAREVAGIDIREPALRSTQSRFPAADLRAGCASELPWPAHHFDLTFASTLLSSLIEFEFRRRVAEELWRVTRPGGSILIYDSRSENPRNPDHRAVTRAELATLFPGGPTRSVALTIKPHWLRRLPAWVSRYAYSHLSRVPGLTSHLLSVVNRSHDSRA